MPVGSVACISLVVSRCYASEFLDLCEMVFDEMAPLVHVGIVVPLNFSVRFGRDDSGCATLIKVLQEPVGVEGFVGQQRPKGSPLDQRSDPLHVVCLSRQKQKPEQVTERIDQGHDLGRQSAARASDSLVLSPPFAPEAF